MSYFATGELDARDWLVLANLPDEIASARVSSAIPRAGDGAAVNAAVQESLASFRQWPISLPWVQRPIDNDTCELWCRVSRANFLLRCDFQFLIWHQSSASVVGNFAIHTLDCAALTAEIGYWGRTSTAGKGYMVEAGAAVLAWGQQHLAIRSYTCTPEVTNVRSIRFARALGFEYTTRDELEGSDRVRLVRSG